MEKNKPTHTDFSSPPSEGLGEASYIEIQISGSVARINLNRPERHNAIVPDMLLELNQALNEIAQMDELQFVVLSGNGRSFCAGADLNWFSGSEERSTEQNATQYKLLADLLLKLYNLPQITISIVRGNVFGGGIGLMATCDFVIAESSTRFMFSEVKLGLLPATILPFVAKRLSIQNMRKWILTGNLFTAAEAQQSGLADLLSEDGNPETTLSMLLESFKTVSPSAMKKAKRLINQVSSGDININDTSVTSDILAEALLSQDGQEGIQAFLEKRKPVWKK